MKERHIDLNKRNKTIEELLETAKTNPHIRDLLARNNLLSIKPETLTHRQRQYVDGQIQKIVDYEQQYVHGERVRQQMDESGTGGSQYSTRHNQHKRTDDLPLTSRQLMGTRPDTPAKPAVPAEPIPAKPAAPQLTRLDDGREYAVTVTKSGNITSYKWDSIDEQLRYERNKEADRQAKEQRNTIKAGQELGERLEMDALVEEMVARNLSRAESAEVLAYIRANNLPHAEWAIDVALKHIRQKQSAQPKPTPTQEKMTVQQGRIPESKWRYEDENG